MSKTINVPAHVKRYQTTELSNVIGLIGGLQALVEVRRAETITNLKEKLELLEKGEIPIEAPKVENQPRTTRGGKKKNTTEEAEA